MPVYEYRCDDCDSVFELLRSPRLATKAQPCPECDAESPRILSREFVPFVMRDGLPRKVPDNGKFKNFDEITDAPYASDEPGHDGGEQKKALRTKREKQKQTGPRGVRSNAEVTARTVSGRHDVTKPRISKSRK